MIAYFDTSAFVPLVISEPSSDACRELWDLADDVGASRLLYVETAAALAQAHRLGRLTTRMHTSARTRLAQLWSEMSVVEVDEPLAERAADLAGSLGLRGNDAVHCASAELAVLGGDGVVACGDQQMLGALQALGLATFDPNSPAP